MSELPEEQLTYLEKRLANKVEVNERALELAKQADLREKVIPLLKPEQQQIVQANADGSIRKEPPRAVNMNPFPDDKYFKYAPAPNGGPDICLVVNTGPKDTPKLMAVAVTRSSAIADMICNAVNLLFYSHIKMEQEKLNDSLPKVLPEESADKISSGEQRQDNYE